MIDVGYCQTMARYGAWMNAKLFALCAGLPDEVRKQDRGAFFRSIHGTLNHILSGDLAWLSRFTGDPEVPPPLGVELFADFDPLVSERQRCDARLQTWSAQVEHGWLEAPMAFTSQTDGIRRTLPTWVLVVHMFNHGTHHRGQLTTLLRQLGLDPGETDLHKLPGLARIG
jgi:uncharacterized damage-inducible protein DinB